MAVADSADTPEVAPARLPPHGGRVIAFWIDLAAVGVPIVFLWAMGQLAGVGSVWLAVSLVGASFVTYTAISVWLAGGATVGKAAFGLAVRRADGSPVTASGRCLAWAVGRQSIGYVVIDVFGLGSLVAMIDGRRRALHDLGFASQVVALEEAATVPARRRLEEYSTRVEAALKDLRREYRWLLFLWKWLTKIVLLVLMWLLAATRLGARVDHSLSTTQPAAAANTALSPGATAAVWVSTAALTTGAVIGGATVVLSEEDEHPRPTTTSGTVPPSELGEGADVGPPGAASVDSELVGRWGVDRPPEEAALFGDALLEIRVGPEPTLFTGGQSADSEPTDCPAWGDLRLDEPAEPTDRRLFAPTASDSASVPIAVAWSGTIRSWCMGSPDAVSPVLVGLFSDGDLLMVFPDGEPLAALDDARAIFLSRRD